MSRAQLADLSALADGTVNPRRADAIESWLAASPQARRVYERERRAVELLHSARLERAPSRLRARVNAQRAWQKRSRPRRVSLQGGAAGAVGAAGLLVALVLAGGTASPSVSQAAQPQDRLEGRPALTVYYQRGADVVAYTIMGSPALSEPAARVTRLDGFDLRTLSARGRTVVTWRRAGHTCVIPDAGTPPAVLQRA